MNPPRLASAVALGIVAATGAAVENVPLNYYTATITVIGGLYTVGKVVHAVWKWGNEQIHESVDQAIAKHMTKLKCVQTKGALCDAEWDR